MPIALEKMIYTLKTTVTALSIAALLIPSAQAVENSDPAPKVTAVEHIDINRYAGKWYEIARLPMFFQRNCASDVTATYRLETTKSGGPATIMVDNRCRKANGEMIGSIGQAQPLSASNSQLQVTFLPTFLRWLPVGKAPYWILKIDEDYTTALVGNPEHKYLWLLSRTPQISDETYQNYIHEAQKQGFDTTKLIRTVQNTSTHSSQGLTQ